MRRKQLSIDTLALNGALVLRVTGRLDRYTTPTFETKVLETIEAGHTRLVFDLELLDYISSAGLRVFLMAHNLLGRGKGKIAVAAAQEQVYHIFNIAGFEEILQFRATPEEAAGTIT